MVMLTIINVNRKDYNNAGSVIAAIGQLKKQKTAQASGEKMDEEKRSAEEDKLCKVCMDKPIDSIILHCGTLPLTLMILSCLSR